RDGISAKKEAHVNYLNEPMDGRSSLKTDENGWTWIFRNNKDTISKPIGNPFQKDLEKSLSNVWIGTFHLFVTTAKYQRQNLTDSNSRPNGQNFKQQTHNIKPSPAFTNVPPVKPSFASVVHGSSSTVDYRVPSKIRSISLKEQDLVHVQEIGTWSINILDESLDSQTSKTESDENKVDNPEVTNSVDELDELIEDLNENNGHNEDIVEDINESNNEKPDNQKMEENINIQQTSSNESSLHELSRPLALKISRKKLHPLAIVPHPLLGYDVRGCQKSLKKMIDGIGFHINRIGNCMQQHNGAFVLFGDLNEVRFDYERLGSAFSQAEGTKLSKLDRFLLSANVIEALPDAQVIALDRLRSDHNPILFHCKKIDYGLTPFRLYHSWFNRDGFDDLISSEWNSFNQNLSSHEKLKALKAKINVWLRGTKNRERIHKDKMLAALKNLETNIDSNIASLEDRETCIKLLHEIDKIDSLEALDLHQKSRIKWDIEGDENSKFFHGLVNQRHRTNSIHGIMSDGTWITDPLQVKETFLDFFKAKFQPHDPMTDLPSISCPSNLSPSDHDMLEKDATLEEIKSAVWDCGNDKALGPDGFTFGFIKRYWELLKNDIMEFVTRFLDTKKMPMGSNSSFITLIPKVSNPIHVKDYRPISLINIHYKLIAKVLASRLAKVVDKIVSQEQSGFILGRQILDGPLMLSEMIDWFKKKKKKMLIFKVDFEKAFDYVSWKYLDFMLHNLGFGPTWRSWIKACLESSRTSILVNGSPTSEFSVKRDLRQGDPLSPFLFIIVIEGLHTDLMEASHSGLILGIKIGSSNITLSYIFYADDVVITSEWSSTNINNIIRVLQVFYLASGLKINIHKSNVYGVGVSDIEKANLLSIGGRLTLIKSVHGSLGIYYLSIFKTLETVLNLLEKKRASFFWGGTHDSRKLAWVKWPIILASRVNGGLGIGSLKAFNLALLQKWHWRIISITNALWVKVIKAFHGQEGCFGPNDISSNGIWAKIVGSSNYLHSNAILPSDSIRFHVGCGTSIRFWKDLWTGSSPLYLRYNRLFRLKQDNDCLISDHFKDNQWTWNWSVSLKILSRT
ncbi:putative RNA-directed DNA polymerase, partial [Tanacetum coccineum]